MAAVTTEPLAVVSRSARKSSLGLSTSWRPSGPISKTPTSLTAPKRFFAARRMRSDPPMADSPSK